MKKLIARFLEWLDQREDDRRLRSIAAEWARMGVVAPYAVAEEERFLRLKLEEFRTYASARWMADQTVTRDELKDAWLKEVVGPMARVPQAREAAKCLKAAILAMGEEMFCGDAKKERKQFCDRKVAEAVESAKISKIEMRRRAMAK